MTVFQIDTDIIALRAQHKRLAVEVASTSDDATYASLMKQLRSIDEKLQRRYKRRALLRSQSRALFAHVQTF